MFRIMLVIAVTVLVYVLTALFQAFLVLLGGLRWAGVIGPHFDWRSDFDPGADIFAVPAEFTGELAA